MSKYAFAALDGLGGYHIEPRGEMQIKVKLKKLMYKNESLPAAI